MSLVLVAMLTGAMVGFRNMVKTELNYTCFSGMNMDRYIISTVDV